MLRSHPTTSDGLSFGLRCIAVEISSPNGLPLSRAAGGGVGWSGGLGRHHSPWRRIRKTPGVITAKARGSSVACRLIAEVTIYALRLGDTPAKRINTMP